MIAISSSGNSKSIVNAIMTAKTARSQGDYNVYVPIEHYGIVESIHTVILQQIVDIILEINGAIL